VTDLKNKKLIDPNANWDLSIKMVDSLTSGELQELCDATISAIQDGGGFGWVKTPPREILERFWNGVILVPGRQLMVGRVDGTIAASVQCVEPPKNNEAQSFAVQMLSFFVAPWARGHGLGKLLIQAFELHAKQKGFEVINLDVRETQKSAIQLFESMSYEKWGTHPEYAKVDSKGVKGYFYTKNLKKN
jgi:ribosomal protein S18 acetylase RimI-like enzyme